MIKIISSKIVIGNPARTADILIKNIMDNLNSSTKIILLQHNCITGSNLGHMVYNNLIKNKICSAIEKLEAATSNLAAHIVLSQDIINLKQKCSYVFVLYKGTHIKYQLYNHSPYVSTKIANQPIIVFPNILTTLLNPNSIEIGKHYTILAPSNYPLYGGSSYLINERYKVLSKKLECNIYGANGSISDTAIPKLYAGMCCHYSIGKVEFLKNSLYNPIQKELKFITNSNNSEGKTNITQDDIQEVNKSALNPRMPYIYGDCKSYLMELFELQVLSLYKYLKNINIKKVVIGISGGLDSTLALLVCVTAFDKLNIKRSNIKCVTMPGMGTTTNTKTNAKQIITMLGVDLREIDIKKSVEINLYNIKHDIDKHDTTFENCQARERTQILLNIANMEGAIVVGTSDLSEISIGFCTFGGDNIAHLNINACISKTMLRLIIRYIIEESKFELINPLLKDILNTPISPELLPPDEHGNIVQKTEDIVAPYELIDFFLYYLIVENYDPKQIFEITTIVFENSYQQKYILEKLKDFLTRFYRSQFKKLGILQTKISAEYNLIEKSFPAEINVDIVIDETIY